VVDTLTDPDLDVPTAVTFTAGSLYAVNARFTTVPDPTPATTSSGWAKVRPFRHWDVVDQARSAQRSVVLPLMLWSVKTPEASTV